MGDLADLAAQLAAMQQAFSEQQAHHAQEMQHVHLSAQQAVQAHQVQNDAHAAALQGYHAAQQQAQQAAQAARMPSVRVDAPKKFDGSIKTLDTWLSSTVQQFEYHEHDTDAKRVRFAAVLLDGAARDWWQQLDANAKPTRWDDLVAALRQRFQPIDSADESRAKLDALRQAGGSVSDYVNSFRRLLGPIVKTVSAEDQLWRFLRGLNQTVAYHVRMGNPRTYAEAEIAAVLAGSTAAPPSSSSSSSSSSGSHDTMMDCNRIQVDNQGTFEGEILGGDDDAPVTQKNLRMFIAAMQQQRLPAGGGTHGRGALGANGGFEKPRGPPSIPHLTPDQVMEHMKGGLCFECKTAGHISRYCPNRRMVTGADGIPRPVSKHRPRGNG